MPSVSTGAVILPPDYTPRQKVAACKRRECKFSDSSHVSINRQFHRVFKEYRLRFEGTIFTSGRLSAAPGPRLTPVPAALW
jgi:hypothetical protein